MEESQACSENGRFVGYLFPRLVSISLWFTFDRYELPVSSRVEEILISAMGRNSSQDAPTLVCQPA